MNTHPGRPQEEPLARLDERLLALEDRVTALAGALRVLAHGLEDLPAAESGGRRAAEAARKPLTCCWWRGSGPASRDVCPAPDEPAGGYRFPALR